MPLKVENANVPSCAAHIAVAAFTCGGLVGTAETGEATAAVSPAATTNVAPAICILRLMSFSLSQWMGLRRPYPLTGRACQYSVVADHRPPSGAGGDAAFRMRMRCRRRDSNPRHADY